ncbi:MAG: sigma-70 family RNA polymerase sigma factor [Anaerolineae bacterium]|nr:sigma-70 family RNA polymerase sigma factor [Anaerolineae bacterium]
MKQDDEQGIIRQAQAGDTAAFATLVEKYGQLVFNLALRTLHDRLEAEDIAQETFVRAWRALPRFRAEAQFTTWLYRITINLCYNRLPHLRQELAAMDADEVTGLPDERQTMETRLVTVELMAQVQTAVINLPDSYRLLITLRHIHDLSYQEIAEVTNLPLGSVKTGIFRARRLLRQVLQPYEELTHG